MKTLFKYFIIIGIVFFSIPFSVLSQTGHWVNMNPSVSPPARAGNGMAYLKDDLVLIFGGISNKGYLEDTWIYDLTKNLWTEIKTDIHPSKRYLPAMVHIDDGKALLFGGDAFSYDSDETWLFDYESLSWTELKPLRKPSPRDRTSSAFLGDKKIIIFSGFPDPEDFKLDTWIFDLKSVTWDSLKSKSPLNRELGMMCELDSQKVFLYGGHNIGFSLNDNWVFDRHTNTWEKIIPKNWNFGRSSSSMAQLKTNMIFLFGGDSRDSIHVTPEYQWSDDTWLYLGKESNWIQLNPQVKPSGRYFHKMAKIGDGKILLFGGANKSSFLNDSWLFQYDGTDMTEEPNNPQFIYPNPASDFIEISVEVGSEPALTNDVRIINVFGQIVSTPNPTPTLPASREGVRIDVSNLAPGMYFVRIGDRVGKFLKIK
jgi:N-acetylneuraminic acid mutarotase